MTNKILEHVEQAYLKKDVPQFDVGDTVDVHTRIIEGEKERIQVFSGTVIMKKGRGINETFTVRRIVNNEGVERIFPLHSPFISKVAVKRSGETRRAKLFYLRDRVGKAVKLTERSAPRLRPTAPPARSPAARAGRAARSPTLPPSANSPAPTRNCPQAAACVLASFFQATAKLVRQCPRARCSTNSASMSRVCACSRAPRIVSTTFSHPTDAPSSSDIVVRTR